MFRTNLLNKKQFAKLRKQGVHLDLHNSMPAVCWDSAELLLNVGRYHLGPCCTWRRTFGRAVCAT